LGAFAKLRKATVSFFMSVRTKQLGSHWTNSRENLYLSICQKSVDKMKFHYNRKKKGTLHGDLCAYVIKSRRILLRMRNVSDTIIIFIYCNWVFTRWQLLGDACRKTPYQFRTETNNLSVSTD